MIRLTEYDRGPVLVNPAHIVAVNTTLPPARYRANVVMVGDRIARVTETVDDIEKMLAHAAQAPAR